MWTNLGKKNQLYFDACLCSNGVYLPNPEPRRKYQNNQWIITTMSKWTNLVTVIIKKFLLQFRLEKILLRYMCIFWLSTFNVHFSSIVDRLVLSYPSKPALAINAYQRPIPLSGITLTLWMRCEWRVGLWLRQRLRLLLRPCDFNMDYLQASGY